MQKEGGDTVSKIFVVMLGIRYEGEYPGRAFSDKQKAEEWAIWAMQNAEQVEGFVGSFPDECYTEVAEIELD
jgi:hypothetical protein